MTALLNSFYNTFSHDVTGYVLLIARSAEHRKVAVVRKTKPSWQAGRFNFPGGKIEARESPLTAAIRENIEEVGIAYAPCDLRPVAVLAKDGEFEVFVFAVESEKVVNSISKTEERVSLLDTLELRLMGRERGIENLAWLYGMAFDGYAKCARIEYADSQANRTT